MNAPAARWNTAQVARNARLAAGAALARGKLVAHADTTALLQAVLRPGDRVCLEVILPRFRGHL